MGSDPTVAEAVVEYLEELSVQYIHGNPGTTELPFVQAVRSSDISYRLCLHEDVAVGCASGESAVQNYSDFERTGVDLGVANLHTSGGLAHGLANLYGAGRSRTPLLTIVGTQSLDFRHEEPILSDSCEPMVREFVQWSGEINEPSSALARLRKAIRAALTPPRGPSVLALPLDVAQAPYSGRVHSIGDISSGGSASPEKITELSELLENSSEIGLVVGDELGQYGRETVQDTLRLAERTGAYVFGEILAAHCNFPKDSDPWISPLPPDTNLCRQLLDLETVVFMGCKYQTALFESDGPIVPESTTAVQVNATPGDIGTSQPVDLAVAGDPRDVIKALLQGDLSIPKTERTEREEHRTAVQELVDLRMDELRSSPDSSEYCTQKNVVEVMSETLEDAFIVDEGVTGRFELLTQGSLKPERYLSNRGGALGYGLPASLGVAFAAEAAETDVPVLAYIGDGSFWYYPQTLHTAQRYELNLTVLVLRNDRYQILEDNAEDLMGRKPDFDTTRLVNLSSEEAGTSQGVRSTQVQPPPELKEVLQRELQTPSPGLIEVDLTGVPSETA